MLCRSLHGKQQVSRGHLPQNFAPVTNSRTCICTVHGSTNSAINYCNECNSEWLYVRAIPKQQQQCGRTPACYVLFVAGDSS
jgi:hypothetical protein